MKGKRRTNFDPRQFTRSQEGRLVIGFFILLYTIGGGLIWLFYGWAAALFGSACITGGLLFFLLLYGLMLLIGYWAGE